MKRSYRSVVAVAAAVLCFGLVLAACSDDDVTGVGMDGDGMEHDHDESSPVAEGARRIEVNATSFAYDPDEITVDAGEDVAIVLTSDDLLHDFAIDEIDVHVAADRDETSEGGFRADTPGEYTFYCTVAGHRKAGMEGTLIVEEP